ncbi:MAG TPA: WD40 repeat domain-containing protein [Longimicrobium sp.]|nr:WD40 repeat domain-containing protein [Longimicrobium sp.]
MPQDNTVLTVSYEGMHLVHLGPPVTIESDHDHADWELWDGEGATFHYRGKAWEVLGLAKGQPLLTGHDGERLVVDVLNFDRGIISVVQHDQVIWSSPFKNFSGDWVSATFSPDGRFIVLGCPYDFDFHVWMRADEAAPTTAAEPGTQDSIARLPTG